jgi:hypothetical protein
MALGIEQVSGGVRTVVRGRYHGIPTIQVGIAVGLPPGQVFQSIRHWRVAARMADAARMDVVVSAVAIAIGVAMIAQWAVSLARGRVPELETRPIEIRLHLLAEFATAAVLVAGGAAMIAGASVAAPMTLFGFGMLTYTAIVSPGYFLDRGERGPVVMFVVVILLALVSAAIISTDLAA